MKEADTEKKFETKPAAINSQRILQAAKQTRNALIQALPVLAGVLILVSLAIADIPRVWYSKIFTDTLLDPVIGAAAGSVAAGNPLTSYIIGGELLKGGVWLVAIVAFIIAWVTVGIVQFPAESLMLGKRFALARNISAFLLSIIIALLVVGTLQITGVGVWP